MARLLIRMLIIALVVFTSGCITAPNQGDNASNSSTRDPPLVFELLTNQLPAAAYDSKIVPVGDGFYLLGSFDSRNEWTDPYAWHLDSQGKISNGTQLGYSFQGRWVHATPQDNGAELIGYNSRSGLCCERQYAGWHSDGYYVRYAPFLQHWNFTDKIAERTPLDCEQRGRFSIAELAGTRYIVGGKPTFSTDEPAAFDAAQILRLPAGADTCEPTDVILPHEVERPILLVVEQILHILPRDGQEGWAFDTTTQQLNTSRINLPSNLDYTHAKVVQTPDAIYLVGASTTFENRSRIIRISQDGVQIQQESLDRLGWEAAAVWDGKNILIIGGADHVANREWTASSAITRYSPSDAAATQVPPLALFDYEVDNSTVIFNGSMSYDSDGFIAKWSWKFIGVDRCYRYDDCYSAEDPLARHQYSEPGTYEVELAVTDDLGLVSRIRQNVTLVA